MKNVKRNSKTALVTGGAGFIGSNLCKHLIKDGFRVICMDNLLTGSMKNIQDISAGDFIFLKADVTDPEVIDTKESIDFIFHLASPASPSDYYRYPVHTLKAGALGTINILEIAKARQAVMLLASTSEVYGDPDVHPQVEEYHGNTNPVGPRSVYTEAKRFAEAATVAYYRSKGVDTKIARIFNTYGPNMQFNDGRAIPSFIVACLKSDEIHVYGDGSQTRSFCYIDDMVEGLIRLINSDLHMPVNLGNPSEIKILEIAETIRNLTGKEVELVFLELPDDDPKLRRPDISKARYHLGWEPIISLDEGLRKTIEWFKKDLGGLIDRGSTGKEIKSHS